jgi:hypothetical protein
MASLERTIATQHARVMALRDSDATAQFFRINASKRKRHNFIAQLRDGDRRATEQEEMEDIATGFFSELLGHAQPRAHDLDLGAMGLEASDLGALDAEFSNAEI